MNDRDISDALHNPDQIRRNAFAILRCIASMLGSPEREQEAQSLIIRALEHRDAFSGYEPLLRALVREVGLFPYIDDPRDLGIRDQIAYEFHRPPGFGDRAIVFHRVQAQVYRDLMSGRSVILSAPTSFGKSLIIDALIVSGKFKNLVVIVPTIALIDETRRRLAQYSSYYKIITHSSQGRSHEKGNIFVLTQERMLDRSGGDLHADLFIIDEFYKLNDSRDRERSNHLNQVLYKLLKSCPQFYFLGPNIRQVPTIFLNRYGCTFLVTDYNTVATEIQKVAIDENREVTAVGMLQELKDEPVLVYCKSPASTKKLCEALIASGYDMGNEATQTASSWIGRHYHPTWIFAQGLRRGIGLHHGRVPRALAQHVVRLFNEAKLNLLLCTSTLIEGVNTAARHVVLYDNKIHIRNLDYFTYNNIKGRGGRMFRHFVGTVHLFDDPPKPTLLDVDFPILTQDDDTPLGVLVQMDDEDLSERSKMRLDPLLTQETLDLTVIRENSYMDPDMQVAAARAIVTDITALHSRLAWSGEPSDTQIYDVCEFLGRYLIPRGVFSTAVKSARQLAYRVVDLRRARGLEAYLRAVIAGAQEESRDDAVEEALEFLRNWAAFHFPRSLTGLQRIANHVFSRYGLRAAEYSYFASQIENWFTDSAVVALDEYGVPIQLGQRLLPLIGSKGDLDVTLDKLKHLDLSRVKLEPFESEVMRYVVKSL